MRVICKLSNAKREVLKSEEFILKSIGLALTATDKRWKEWFEVLGLSDGDYIPTFWFGNLDEGFERAIFVGDEVAYYLNMEKFNEETV